MTAVSDELLDTLAERIVAEVDPEKIILFGSRARDAASEDSDIDLLVIERLPFGPGRSRRAELSRIRRALYPLRVPVDILVYSLDEVQEWQDSINHLIPHCLKEGKVLHDRSQTRPHDD